MKCMRDSRRPTVGMSMVDVEDSEDSSERDVGWDGAVGVFFCPPVVNPIRRSSEVAGSEMS